MSRAIELTRSGIGQVVELCQLNAVCASLFSEYLAVFKKTVSSHEVFLQRLSSHAILSKDRNFHVFLEYDQDVRHFYSVLIIHFKCLYFQNVLDSF